MADETDDKAAILDQAAQWMEQGLGVAVATLLSAWGSAPRPVGSLMAVAVGGRMAGSVSAGCIEGAVAYEAERVIEEGEPRVLTFGISDERAWEVGLACGGKLSVYLEPLL